MFVLIKSFTAGSGQVIEWSKKQPMHKSVLQHLVCHILSAKLCWAIGPVQNGPCAEHKGGLKALLPQDTVALLLQHHMPALNTAIFQ